MINQLPPSDDTFNQLSGSFFSNVFKAFTNEKDKGSFVKMIVFACILLTFVGVAAVRLIFRNNFGRNGLGIGQLIISVIVFIGLSIYSYNIYSSFDRNMNMAEFGSKTSFICTAIFYFALSIFLLVKGIVEFKKKAQSKASKGYRGDSTLLGFLSESGWNHSKIQNLAEPLLVLAIGVFLAPINLLLGVPLIICALSVWVHYLYDFVRGLLNARNELANNYGFDKSNEQKFSRAK